MGMFDEVVFTHIMPDGFQNRGTYQTKDLDCTLERYQIISGILFTTSSRVMWYDGILKIYTNECLDGYSGELKEYELRFEKGVLLAIKPMGGEWIEYKR